MLSFHLLQQPQVVPIMSTEHGYGFINIKAHIFHYIFNWFIIPVRKPQLSCTKETRWQWFNSADDAESRKVTRETWEVIPIFSIFVKRQTENCSC